jgi:hypothetical protein
MKVTAVLCGALLTAAFAAPASAAVSGQLNIGGGPNQVIVGLTSIDWEPVATGTGTFDVGGGTTITTAGGPLPIGSLGTIRDLPPVPSPNFMTFQALPALSFTLNTIGPGSAITDCASADTVGESCSPFVGSPFILTFVSPTQTSISLSAAGTASDGTMPGSTWSGLFTAQVPNLTPVQIQQVFGCVSGGGIGACTNQGATIRNTYSGSFVATVVVVPEPATLALLGLGLVGVGIRARRRRQ